MEVKVEDVIFHVFKCQKAQDGQYIRCLKKEPRGLKRLDEWAKTNYIN